MTLTFEISYRVRLENGRISIGKLTVNAPRSVEAKVLGRERVKNLTGIDPEWVGAALIG